jgi:hypothetical protein
MDLLDVNDVYDDLMHVIFVRFGMSMFPYLIAYISEIHDGLDDCDCPLFLQGPLTHVLRIQVILTWIRIMLYTFIRIRVRLFSLMWIQIQLFDNESGSVL